MCIFLMMISSMSAIGQMMDLKPPREAAFSDFVSIYPNCFMLFNRIPTFISEHFKLPETPHKGPISVQFDLRMKQVTLSKFPRQLEVRELLGHGGGRCPCGCRRACFACSIRYSSPLNVPLNINGIRDRDL